MDFLPTKGIEYLLVVGYLVLFIPFWRLFFHERDETPRARVRTAGLLADDMFRLPDGLLLHPGHAWTRLEGYRRARVGLDDFARHLVGPVVDVVLPAVGSRVEQGAPAVTLKANAKTVDVISPVTGRVTAVNPDASAPALAVNGDPYGGGWLFTVDAPRLDIDRRQLVSGRAAHHLMASSWEELSAMLTPGLGTIMHDGGVPIDGFARAIDHDDWDRIAGRFLKSEQPVASQEGTANAAPGADHGRTLYGG